jgi:nitroreductase
MDAMETMFSRRSIRDYTKDVISREIIHELLQAAMSAPSSKNLKPWHFIVMDDRRTLNRIPLYFPYTYMVRRAPLAVIVCGDKSKSAYDIYWTFDCSAATENLVLAANAKGLGAVWCGAYMAEVPQEVSFQTWLGIPDNIVPFAIVPIGYPAESKSGTDRYEPEKVHLNRW